MQESNKKGPEPDETESVGVSINSNISSTGRVLTQSQVQLKEELHKMCAYCFRKDIPLLKVRGSVIGDYLKEVVRPFFLTLFCAKCVIAMYRRAINENFASENSRGMIVHIDQQPDQSLEAYARSVVRSNITRINTSSQQSHNGTNTSKRSSDSIPDAKRSISSILVSSNSIDESIRSSQDVPRGVQTGGGLFRRKVTSAPQPVANRSTSSEGSVSDNTRQKIRNNSTSSSDAPSTQSFNNKKTSKKAPKRLKQKRALPPSPPGRPNSVEAISYGAAPRQNPRIRTAEDGMRHIGG